MPLKLVTGPANSAKAAEVLGGVRAALDREPLLVVPTAADVDRYRRELAEGGIVFGARVVRFAELVEEAARRAGQTGVPLGATARDRLVAAVAARTRLDVLAASRATPGFAGALARLFAELEVARVDPGRLAVGLRAWAAGEAGRRAYGDELAALYRGYRAALERLGRQDAEQHALAALDALRLEPRAWGASPVFFYGFDDLTPLQRDAVETLAKHVDAPVTVSLSYEPGRRAFAGRAATFEELRPLADEIVALEPLPDHYAPASRAALHGLERALFEEQPASLDPGDAVAILEAGGERAEIELAAAEVRRLLDAGVPAEEIALVVRSPEEAGPLVERVLAEFGVPFALRRRVPFSHLAVGRGLLALLRCATGAGTAEDAVAYLRTPGVVRHPSLVDRLEARVRRQGTATAADALAAWADDGRHVPAALERVRLAAETGPAALCARLATELNRLLVADPSAPAPPSLEEGEVPTGPVAPPPAPTLAADARAEASAVAAARRALAELGELAESDRALVGGAAEVAEALGGVEVVVGEEAGPGRVSVADPLALRARRVRALVLCALQEGAFPRPSRGEAFLGDEERRELAIASGIRLPFEADGGLGAERYLFYATVSRPEERLVLGFHTAGDDGDPTVPSFFLDDVRDLFAPTLWDERARRPLGAVAWPGEPPTQRAGARAAAADGPPRRPASLAPLSAEPALRALRERPAWSASSLEVWAKCPVKWFVERYLNAEDLEADPEPMVRGSVAHETLEVTLRGLREQTGSARVTPAQLGEVRERMRAALREAATRAQISPNPERLAAGLRRLEADLDRYLETAAHSGSTYEPTWFEVGFGFTDDPESLPALELEAPDGPLRLRGRIDRIDVSPQGDRAVIVDYKGRRVTAGERWIQDGSFQAALYLRAARDLLGLEPAGALYQPLGSGDARPRGLVVEDVDPELDLVGTDRRCEERVDEILTTVIDLATAAAAEARAGALEPRPETCTPQKTCAYPGLCRCEAT